MLDARTCNAFNAAPDVDPQGAGWGALYFNPEDVTGEPPSGPQVRRAKAPAPRLSIVALNAALQWHRQHGTLPAPAELAMGSAASTEDCAAVLEWLAGQAIVNG